MAAPSFFDNVKVHVVSKGQDDFELGGAVDGFLSPSDVSIPNGATLRCSAFTEFQRESFTGTYDASAGTISRDTVHSSTAGGAKVDFASEPVLVVTFLAVDATALSPLIDLGQPTADGQFIVATGAGAFQYESGATARASLDVYSTGEVDALITAEDLDFAGDSGTGSVDLDSQSLAIATGNDSLATAALNQTLTISLADVLEDLDTLGPNAADGEFLVGTGAGALDWESGETARASIGITTGNTDNALLRADGVGGATLQPTGITVDDSDNVSGAGIDLSANTLTGTTAEFNAALSDDDFATLAGTETLENKTLTSPDINGGTADALTSLGIRSSGAGAFDLQIQNTEALTAARALTFSLGDAPRTITLSGNTTLDDWFDQSVKQAASPTFAGLTLDGAIGGTGVGIDDGDVLVVDATAGTPADDEYARFTANGLEGRTEAEFKADFNLEIGTDVQAWDAGLDDISGLAVSDGNFIVGDGANWVAESGPTVRTSLGLGTGDTPEFTGLTLSGDITDYEAANDGNPEIRLGSADAEELHIQSVFDTGTQTLDYVLLQTDVTSASANKGLFRFNVDGTDILDIDDGGIDLDSGMALSIAGTDVLDATTLGTNVVNSSLTSVGTIGTGTWEGTAIDHERGGLEADVSAFTGLLAISGGATSEVDTKSELEAQLTDVSDFAMADGDAYTGTHDFGGADDLEIPNSATPTVDTDGQVALDTSVTDFSHGILKYFGGEEMAVVALPIAQLTTPGDGDVVAYNAANDEFELSASGGGGGSDPTPYFTVTRSTDQSIDTSTFTDVEFDNEVLDSDADFDNATNFRFTPSTAGKYVFFANAALGSLANAKAFLMQIRKNDTDTLAFGQITNGGGADVAFAVASQITDMNGTTDYVDVRVWHNNGSALNILADVTWFSGYRVE